MLVDLRFFLHYSIHHYTIEIGMLSPFPMLLKGLKAVRVGERWPGFDWLTKSWVCWVADIERKINMLYKQKSGPNKNLGYATNMQQWIRYAKNMHVVGRPRNDMHFTYSIFLGLEYPKNLHFTV